MLNRRSFLAWLGIGAAACAAQGVAPVSLQAASRLSGICALQFAPQAGPYDLQVRDYYGKMRRFDTPSDDDVVLRGEELAVLHVTQARLQRLVKTVGYANFALLGFDDAVRMADSYPAVGAFTRDELEFLECQFYADAAVYGFYGIKAINRLTDRVRGRDVVKVPYSGNYLFKGEPHATWEAIHANLGNEVVLTSGVRGVMKQFYLFFNKATQHGGNLSLASRSLAPPGYSFHGVSDFDVGQRGFGEANFSERFTETAVFRRLENLGYLTLRYPRGNRLGVRFEPWHVKVKLA